MKRLLVYAALGIVAVCGLGAGIIGIWIYRLLPVVSAVIEARGLEQPVDVIRDSRGVPHIFAGSAADAYLALGFLHAQDRFWQMEMMRRTGAGRLAEVAGADALPSDRMMRVLGLARLAEAQFDRLDAEVRAALVAYANGVNAWLVDHRGALPVEFLLSGVEPEPWRPSDSLIWGKTMGYLLAGNWRDEIRRARLSGSLSPAQIEQLWPPHGRRRPPRRVDFDDLYQGLPLDRLVEAVPNDHQSRSASNSWVVAGSNSATGSPILANDPHLGFTIPILWYLARIVAPDLEITGATVPGLPFTVLGHNRDIAWGMTATQSDIADVFVERIDPGDPGRYLTPGGSEAFRTRREVIHVRGDRRQDLVVRETRHGPVISDILGGDDGEKSANRVLALSATYLLEDDRTPEALFRVNRATDWESFSQAMSLFHAPQQSFVYADRGGNIGFYAPGRVPIRKSGHGRMPSAGWDGESDWLGFVPYGELPRILNPPEGRIVSANNKIVSDAYPHFLGDDWDPAYRARRIFQLLNEIRSQTVGNTAQIQRDHVSLMALDLLKRMTAIDPRDERERRVVTFLRNWKGVMARRRPEPIIFYAWLRELNRAIYADELGESFESYFGLRPRFIMSVLTRFPEWCDDVRTAETESCESRIALALERSLTRLEERFQSVFIRWRWGSVHTARFSHPVLSRVPVVGRFADRSFPADGGNFTINRGASRIWDRRRPFESVHGAGFRAIYDLAQLDRSRFIIATGQSGSPFSSHYDDLMDVWREGRYIRLNLSRQDLERDGEGTLTLVPGGPARAVSPLADAAPRAASDGPPPSPPAEAAPSQRGRKEDGDQSSFLQETVATVQGWVHEIIGRLGALLDEYVN